MKEYKKESKFTFNIPFNYGQEFLKELMGFTYESNNGSRLWKTNHALWDYKKVTKVREYWNDKYFSIYRDLEPLWQRYLTNIMNCPQTTFLNFLLANPNSHPFLPQSLELYIKIWFETRNTIYQ
jgi:hypothetical protein